MNRFLPAIFIFFAGLVVLCALLTALTSSMAAATASAALLTSQCTNVLVLLVAVLGGLGIGIGLATLRRGDRQPEDAWRSLPPAAWHSPILLPPADDDDELTQALIQIIREQR